MAQIGQMIINSQNIDTVKPVSGKILSFSIQALPGCKIWIDNSEITLGPAGLFNVDIPVTKIAVSTEEDDTNKSLLSGANTQMVIDYIYEDETSGGEQTDG